MGLREIKNFSSAFASRRWDSALVLGWAATLSSCGHVPSRSEVESGATPQVMESPAVVPQVYENAVGPELPVGPLPPEGFSPQKGYVLVLGPGMFRAMAYVGVLKELHSRGVLINAIVGTEMGALVAALQSLKGVASMEWAMTKLRKDALSDTPFIAVGDKMAKGDVIKDFIRSNVHGAQLEQLKLPVYVNLADSEGRPQPLVHQGPLADILRDAVAIRGLMKERTKGALWSAAESLPFPINEAKSLNRGRVIAVDVLIPSGPHGESEFEERIAISMNNARERAEGSLRDADGVISVPVEGVGYLSYENRAELAYRGKTAAAKWAAEEGLK